MFDSILEMWIPPEALGKVIGPRGRTVQLLIDTYGLIDINLEDDGSVQVSYVQRALRAPLSDFLVIYNADRVAVE